MPPELQRMDVEHFVRKLGDLLKVQGGELAFFLGAGCSITSGIPGASQLVDNWCRQLHRQMTGDDRGPQSEWLADTVAGWDPDNPSAAYAEVMAHLFPHSRERQREIERVVRRGHDPGFGYAVLALLITLPDVGRRCNLVLTTNFDDMVADALYLYTRQKPLVIGHDLLVDYAEAGSERPLVVKVHGDALLAPRNVGDETAEIAAPMVEALGRLLQQRGMIFLGYGGNDKGIAKALESLPASAAPWGIYWVNAAPPGARLAGWLADRRARWVEHLDFDKLMLLVRQEFKLPHPKLQSRFDQLDSRYRTTFEDLTTAITATEGAEKAALSKAASAAIADAESWWQVELAAGPYKEADPERADEIYTEGIDRFPSSADLLGNFALFLQNVKGEMGRAEEMYEAAVAADPGHANHLGNFAVFLESVKGEMGRAEEMYEAAVAADPGHANSLGNFALFLEKVKGERGRAEEMFEAAVAADPGHRHANNLGNFASFLWKVKGEMGRAEEMYEAAVAADPGHANHLGNFALFLESVKGEMGRAEEMFEAAVAADPGHANNLGNFAVLLQSVKGEMGRAEEMYEAAVAADPEGANNLGNFGGLLLGRGDRQRGLDLLSRSEQAAGAGDDTLRLEIAFYRYANGRDAERAPALAAARAFIDAGVRSKGWDFSLNIERAIADGHPEPQLLEDLAAVIADEKPADVLDQYRVWKEAAGDQSG